MTKSGRPDLVWPGRPCRKPERWNISLISNYWPVILGSVLNLAGMSYYVWNTVAGTTRPNRVTWLMWSIAPLIGTAAAISSGVTWATLPVFMAGFCPLLVLLASFVNRNSYWQLGVFDYACGGLSLVALVLWLVSNDPNVAIVFAILSDASAAIPTVIKSYRYPETEIAFGYSTSGINNVTSFFVIQNWTFASYAFPGYLVAANVLLTVLILRKFFPRDTRN